MSIYPSRARSKWLLSAILCLAALAGSARAHQSSPRASQRSAQSQRTAKEQRPHSDPGRTLTGSVLADGQPIPEASVVAMPAGVAGAGSGFGALKARSALTDDSGKFVINDLSSGAYVVGSFVPGFVPASDSSAEPVYYRRGDSVTLNMVKGGVITGSVTSSAGEPIAGIRVRAQLVKPEGRRAPRASIVNSIQLNQDWKTDDRGIYRIFGLEPGSYLVSAGGRGLMTLAGPLSEGYDNDAPTFYPSGNRDTAVAVRVGSGEEAGGIDIRYREGPGHVISGTVSGKAKAETARSALVVTLSQAGTGAVCSISLKLPIDPTASFKFDGVGDGEYELRAAEGEGTDDVLGSPPRRIVVNGSDVTGVDLALASLGSISGRAVLEKPQGADAKVCQPRTKASVDDSAIVAIVDAPVREQAVITLGGGFPLFSQMHDGVPDEKGSFKIRPLESGRYRLKPDLPGDDWFVRAITLPAATQSGQPVDAARDGIALKPGERVNGITVTLSEGAAALSGRVIPATEKMILPVTLRLYLVPAEKEAVDHVLRFFEVPVDRDGSFSIKHIVPGRYSLLVKDELNDESNDADRRPLAWKGTASRAKLQREAEASKGLIELGRCQRASEQRVVYSPPAAPQKQ